MRHELNFWVLGGDMRQGKLAQLLAEDGHRVHTYALEDGAVPAPGLTAEPGLSGVEQADCVVLPLPVSSGGGLLNAPLSRLSLPLTEVFAPLSPGQMLCGGRVDPVTAALAAERGLTVRDYFAREELAVANAVPTAEGAIQIAMEQLPITIHGARVLVVGFGRVGRALAQRLAALGAKVTVAARRYESLAWAQASGYGAEQTGQHGGGQRGAEDQPGQTAQAHLVPQRPVPRQQGSLLSLPAPAAEPAAEPEVTAHIPQEDPRRAQQPQDQEELGEGEGKSS